MNNALASPLSPITCFKKTRFRNQTSTTQSLHVIKKRNKRPRKEGFVDGRWTEKEHIIFLKLFKIFGNDWKGIERVMKNRTSIQIRSHAQKYLVKLMKKYKVLKDNKFTPKPSLMKKIDKEDLKFFVVFRLTKNKRIFEIEKDLKSVEKLNLFDFSDTTDDKVQVESETPKQKISKSSDMNSNIVQTVNNISFPGRDKSASELISEKINILISSNKRILMNNIISTCEDKVMYKELLEYLEENEDSLIDFFDCQIKVSSLMLLYKYIKELSGDCNNISLLP